MAFVNKFDEIRSNNMKSTLLVSSFIVIIGILGGVIGLIYGSMWFGLIIALIFAGIYSLIAYNSGANMILSSSGAKPVTKKEYPHLYHSIEGLAIAAGIPTPKAYVINSPALNAFATGKDPKHASITVTTGLINKLNREELEGVIAHEMAHIKNYDIRLMMLTVVLVGVIALLSHFILRSFLFGGGRDREGSKGAAILIIVGLIFAILTPIVSHIIQLAVSRKREFAADATGALLTRYPEGLASALEKIKNDSNPKLKNASSATAHLYISTPDKKKHKSSIWSTHPNINERIKRLRSM